MRELLFRPVNYNWPKTSRFHHREVNAFFSMANGATPGFMVVGPVVKYALLGAAGGKGGGPGKPSQSLLIPT